MCRTFAVYSCKARRSTLVMRCEDATAPRADLSSDLAECAIERFAEANFSRINNKSGFLMVRCSACRLQPAARMTALPDGCDVVKRLRGGAVALHRASSGV